MRMRWVAVWVTLLAIPPFIDGMSSTELPNLTVLVCDKVGLDIEARAAARDAARRIWHAAGVNMTWVEATGGDRTPTTFDWASLEGCEKPTRDFRFNYFLTIVRKSPPQAIAGSLGIARLQPASRRAYILYDRVERFTKAHRPETATRDVGVILGNAAAHELGHLFMASEDHSLRGIMSTNWRYLQAEEAVAGTLLFQSAEVRQIQDKLRRK